jgi:hypothetical protein
MKDVKLNTVGVIAGVIAWIAIMAYYSTQKDGASKPGAEDTILTGLIALGMLAPAAIVAVAVSHVFQRQK